MAKNGRPTLEDKEQASSLSISEFDESDYLSIDPNLKQEITKKNLAYRWINAKRWQDNYGYDARMWAPYRRESGMTPGYEAFGIVDPEGYTRRGDLILATQKQEIANRRKEKIANKNKGLHANHKKAAAEQLRKDLKGVAKVTEDYEDESEE